MNALLNGICPYYTMFPVDFPLRQLRHAHTGDLVIDPFCGRGTTNFAARLLNLRSVGFDSNPVAVAIAQAKLASTTANRIIAACKELLASIAIPQSVPSGDFWTLCYEESTLLALCKLREALLYDCKSDTKCALRGLLLGILHGPITKATPSYLSNSMPRTYAAKPNYAVRFWRQRKLTPVKVDVAELVSRKARWFFEDCPPKVAARIALRDCVADNLQLAANKAKWVITSPPYYGMRTYISDQWLRNWFLGGTANVTYTCAGQVRHTSPELFSEQLRKVWKKIAHACKPEARMIIRFGGIRDRKQNPSELLRNSLSGTNWKIVTICSAGSASDGKRQANQFLQQTSRPIEEFDFHVHLH